MAANIAGHGVEAVDTFGQLLQALLDGAELVKKTNAVDPPLDKSDLGDLFEQVDSVFALAISPESKKRSQFAVIETAVRESFNSLLASTTIDDPSFVRLWNLLDIISIFSDDEQCDPALLFWLVEELLDSQTIAGCRKIFDYLESRRERITAKHFSQKNLVILRSCNELLRRLSRAEDTAFCGRVFIFMFQSFPLGDKSSVNLRGEYHIENVTTFDMLQPKESDAEKMDVDSETTPNPTAAASKTALSGTANAKSLVEEQSVAPKGVTFSNSETCLSADELYPIFWSLQQSFNQPKRLFDSENFAQFKSGLEATITMFKSAQTDNVGRPAKSTEESKRGTKRKRGQGDGDLANAFNPKYLTSRDLFELEISDLSFRRHILVQVLIVMDFFLSLSAKSKEKLAKASLPDNPNKSVMYADQILSDEDTNWAFEMKRSIAEYLKQGIEGAFFYRMVETVLSRDKNWVRWKIENCPSIAKPSVSPEDYIVAKTSAGRATSNKRLRPNPLGSLDLKFLAEGDIQSGMERLKDPIRYRVPLIKSFKSKIELDDMDIEMARDEETKNSAIESRASKSWRALRIASITKLVAFDKIERSDKIDEIFHDDVKAEEPISNGDVESLENEEYVFPKDRRPLVISGPSGAGKGTLIKMLMEKHAKILGRSISYTTRAPREGEIHEQDYFFVSKEEHNVLRDGDHFLEYNNFDGNDYGTSRKVVEGIIAQGKVPLLEIDVHGIQQLKEKGFAARFILIAPPDEAELRRRLLQRGSDTENSIQTRLEIARKELENSKLDEFYDKEFINNELQPTYEKLERYIFDGDNIVNTTVSNSVEEVQQSSEAADVEVEMADGEPLTEEPLQESGTNLEQKIFNGANSGETPAETIPKEGKESES